MSDTIETRNYSSKHATLLQRQPSSIIDVAESFHQPKAGGGQGIAHIIGTGARGSVIARAMTGATRSVVFVDLDSATAAGAAVEIEDDSDSWLRWARAAKTALQQSTPGAKSTPSATARLRVERLAAVQAALGLSTLDFAQVLGLSRPGLYKWLDSAKDVKLQEASRERLAVVERIAKQWRARTTAPLTAVAHEPLTQGGTVLDLMTAEAINEGAVMAVLEDLVCKLQGKPKTRSQKLTEAGFTRRPSSRSLPSDD